MNIASFLTKAARTFPERPAVSLGTALYLTYGALASRVAQLAGTLTSRFGLEPGDRVAFAMGNRPEYVELLYAAWYAGLIAVPMNAKLHQREFAYILEHSGARLCFATPDLIETVAPLAQELPHVQAVLMTGDADYRALCVGPEMVMRDVAPEAVAWLFYTSGTTGRPKGAMLTHRNLLVMTLSYFADIDPITPLDCTMHAAPMSHGSGLYSLPHVAKAAHQIFPVSGGFHVDELADLIAVYPGVSCFFAPTMVTRLVNHPAALTLRTEHLKTLIYGGGPMYVEDLKRALELFGPKLVQIYGQGEAPMTITVLSKAWHADVQHPCYLERLGSAGIARTDVQVRVVDADDQDVPLGEIGEVLVRGDVVMQGYWQNATASAETLRGGWLHTGDLGALDADGFLTLKDRSKDMIISGGTNIYPREIEEVLLRHPGVLEVSVVGRPHRDWGEEVVAFVVPRTAGSVTAEVLDHLCLDTIARFKRPRVYKFVDSLPKNNYGKILKTALRDQLTTVES
ncbi:MAG: long-chain fatty acid--CoA ligase [Candidatus Tectomicrobia bacterium]|uniref:Long-chain fatty acid--CoA ligase n=1 Tax=Tectimicrobiota bacterium TaxID=2528274 RepID=A0A938B2F2_UNCTE|nr:long-chain fatty acid--CoA ligase [Candidatus Tectomicrobia bacterium]